MSDMKLILENWRRYESENSKSLNEDIADRIQRRSNRRAHGLGANLPGGSFRDRAQSRDTPLETTTPEASDAIDSPAEISEPTRIRRRDQESAAQQGYGYFGRGGEESRYLTKSSEHTGPEADFGSGTRLGRYLQDRDPRQEIRSQNRQQRQDPEAYEAERQQGRSRIASTQPAPAPATASETPIPPPIRPSDYATEEAAVSPQPGTPRYTQEQIAAARADGTYREGGFGEEGEIIDTDVPTYTDADLYPQSDPRESDPGQVRLADGSYMSEENFTRALHGLPSIEEAFSADNERKLGDFNIAQDVKRAIEEAETEELQRELDRQAHEVLQRNDADGDGQISQGEWEGMSDDDMGFVTGMLFAMGSGALPSTMRGQFQSEMMSQTAEMQYGSDDKRLQHGQHAGNIGTAAGFLRGGAWGPLMAGAAYLGLEGADYLRDTAGQGPRPRRATQMDQALAAGKRDIEEVRIRQVSANIKPLVVEILKRMRQHE